MSWKYEQSTGRLYHNGSFIDRGYSGKGGAKNNPMLEGVSNSGPIPRGKYRIGAPFTHPHAGGNTLRLTPINGTQTHGRSGFMMHGDSVANPGQASDGCIIMRLPIRTQVWTSGDHNLEVVW